MLRFTRVSTGAGIQLARIVAAVQISRYLEGVRLTQTDSTARSAVIRLSNQLVSLQQVYAANQVSPFSSRKKDRGQQPTAADRQL
jgi:hypothetical protein